MRNILLTPEEQNNVIIPPEGQLLWNNYTHKWVIANLRVMSSAKYTCLVRYAPTYVYNYVFKYIRDNVSDTNLRAWAHYAYLCGSAPTLDDARNVQIPQYNDIQNYAILFLVNATLQALAELAYGTQTGDIVMHPIIGVRRDKLQQQKVSDCARVFQQIGNKTLILDNPIFKECPFWGGSGRFALHDIHTRNIPILGVHSLPFNQNVEFKYHPRFEQEDLGPLSFFDCRFEWLHFLAAKKTMSQWPDGYYFWPRLESQYNDFVQYFDPPQLYGFIHSAKIYTSDNIGEPSICQIIIEDVFDPAEFFFTAGRINAFIGHRMVMPLEMSGSERIDLVRKIVYPAVNNPYNVPNQLISEPLMTYNVTLPTSGFLSYNDGSKTWAPSYYPNTHFRFTNNDQEVYVGNSSSEPVVHAVRVTDDIDDILAIAQYIYGHRNFSVYKPTNIQEVWDILSNRYFDPQIERTTYIGEPAYIYDGKSLITLGEMPTGYYFLDRISGSSDFAVYGLSNNYMVPFLAGDNKEYPDSPVNTQGMVHSFRVYKLNYNDYLIKASGPFLGLSMAACQVETNNGLGNVVIDDYTIELQPELILGPGTSVHNPHYGGFTTLKPGFPGVLNTIKENRAGTESIYITIKPNLYEGNYNLNNVPYASVPQSMTKRAPFSPVLSITRYEHKKVGESTMTFTLSNKRWSLESNPNKKIVVNKYGSCIASQPSNPLTSNPVVKLHCELYGFSSSCSVNFHSVNQLVEFHNCKQWGSSETPQRWVITNL